MKNWNADMQAFASHSGDARVGILPISVGDLRKSENSGSCWRVLTYLETGGILHDEL